MPPPGLVAGGGLCSPNGSIGALVVEPLALAAGCGSERVRAGDAVAVAVGGDGADVLLPGSTPGRVGGLRPEPAHPRLPLSDGLTGEHGGALLHQVP
jgi:hypothetical protein